jgi:hypothetical protein
MFGTAKTIYQIRNILRETFAGRINPARLGDLDAVADLVFEGHRFAFSIAGGEIIIHEAA